MTRAARRVVVIFGGRSEIGVELAAAAGTGRDGGAGRPRRADRLDRAGRRGAGGRGRRRCTPWSSTPTTWPRTARCSTRLIAEHGPIGTAVLAFGILGDQARAEADAEHAVAVVHTDYVAQVSLLTLLAAAMRAAGRGRMVVFSSVAGARVRRANYVYGSAKAGPGRVRQRAGRRAARHRGAPADRAARVRHRPDDRRAWTRHRCPARPRRSPTPTAQALAKGRRAVWVPWALRPLFFATRLMPQAVWRRMPR